MKSNMIELHEPWWCIEGFVVAPGSYFLVGTDSEGEQRILTTLGVARLLEPAPGAEPSVFSSML